MALSVPLDASPDEVREEMRPLCNPVTVGVMSLGNAFAAGAIEHQQGLPWYRLAPKQKGSDFERVSLGFDSRNELAAMELVDKLRQTTTIEFSRVKRGAALGDSLFHFVPPKGADVIGEAAAR